MLLLTAFLTSCGLYQNLANKPIAAEDQELYRLYLHQDAIRNVLEGIDKIDSVHIISSPPFGFFINVIHARGVTFTDNERLDIEEAAASAVPEVSQEYLRFHYGLQMMLADVIALSQKGEALTMADVREYAGYDQLSGLYGWNCEVLANESDESAAYTLSATSGSWDGALIFTAFTRIQVPQPLPNDLDTGIDIRYYDVMAYIERGEKLLIRPLPTLPPPSATPRITFPADRERAINAKHVIAGHSTPSSSKTPRKR